MTRYDKIYVIDKECPSYIDPIRDGDGNALMEHEGPVIVLTVEELRDIWDAGFDQGDESALMMEGRVNTSIAPDFRTYLQSKGINIEG